jgi:hypothetical protein
VCVCVYECVFVIAWQPKFYGKSSAKG